MTQNENFFTNISPVTFCFNLCLGLNFNIDHKIDKVSIFDREILKKEIPIANIDDLSFLIRYINKVVKTQVISDKKDLHTALRALFTELQDKHSQISLPSSLVKLVLIIDMENPKKPFLKHWTSLPVLGGSESQVRDYFNGVTQLAESVLQEEEKAQLNHLIGKISMKMLGK
jgi:hypothetical protein